MSEIQEILLIGAFVHGLYFYIILRLVPKDSGLAYLDQIRRFYPTANLSAFSEVFNAIYSLASCILVIIGTYKDSDDVYFRSSFSADLWFSTFWVFNFCLDFIITASKSHFLLSLHSFVDIVTIAPTLVTLFSGSSPTSESFYGILGIIRVLRLLRLKRTMTYLTMKGDYNGVNTVNVQLVQMFLNLVMVVLILSGVFHFMVEFDGSDWGEGPGNMPFHSALYFCIITLGTVGYGDISPSTMSGQLLISALVVVFIVLIPAKAAYIMNLISLKPQYDGSVSIDNGNHHVIICCDLSCMAIVEELVIQMKCQLGSANIPHVVLLVPADPDSNANLVLLKLGGESSATYINGDARSAEDLYRAKVNSSQAVFVLSNRYASDTNEQDGLTLVRVLAIQQAAPDVALYCSVVHGICKYQLEQLGVPTSGIVCQGRTIQMAMSQAIAVPGISTIVFNLISNIEGQVKTALAENKKQENCQYALNCLRMVGLKINMTQKEEPLLPVEREYMKSLSNTIIHFPVGEYFAGESFSKFIFEIYLNLECIAVAMRPTQDNGYGLVQLHPGKDWLISPEDSVYLIAPQKSYLKKIYAYAQKISMLKSSELENRKANQLVGSKIVNRIRSSFSALQDQHNCKVEDEKYGPSSPISQKILKPSNELFCAQNGTSCSNPHQCIVDELIGRNLKFSSDRNVVLLMAHSMGMVQWVVMSLLTEKYSCVVLCPFVPSNEASDLITEKELRSFADDSCRRYSLKIVRGPLNSKGIHACNINVDELAFVFVAGGKEFKNEKSCDLDEVTVALSVLVMSMVPSEVCVITCLNSAKFVGQLDMLSTRVRSSIELKLINSSSLEKPSDRITSRLPHYNHFSLKSNYSSGNVVLSSIPEALLMQAFALDGTACLIESLLGSNRALRRVNIPPQFWIWVVEEKVSPSFKYLLIWILNQFDAILIGIQRKCKTSTLIGQESSSCESMLSISVPSPSMLMKSDDYLYIVLPQNVAMDLVTEKHVCHSPTQAQGIQCSNQESFTLSNHSPHGVTQDMLSSYHASTRAYPLESTIGCTASTLRPPPLQTKRIPKYMHSDKCDIQSTDINLNKNVHIGTPTHLLKNGVTSKTKEPTALELWAVQILVQESPNSVSYSTYKCNASKPLNLQSISTMDKTSCLISRPHVINDDKVENKTIAKTEGFDVKSEISPSKLVPGVARNLLPFDYCPCCKRDIFQEWKCVLLGCGHILCDTCLNSLFTNNICYSCNSNVEKLLVLASKGSKMSN